MKMKVFFSCAATFVALLLCCGLNQVQAQSGSLPGSGGKTTTNPTVDFCDLILPAVEKQLKTDANASCSTQSTCVDCMDRASKMVLSATLYVQPDKTDCKGATDISLEEDATASRGAAKQKPSTPRFRPKMMQSPCFAGGTNLEVIVPGHDLNKREFGFMWEVDGKKAGHLSSVTCACGKEAKVRVTHLGTGESVNLTMKLNATCNSTTTSKN